MNSHTRALSSLLSTPHTSAGAEARAANAAATPTAAPGMDFASLMGARVQATQSAQASAAQRQQSTPADTSHRSSGSSSSNSSSTNATAQDQARALNVRRERERVQDRAADHRAQQAAAAARQQAARPAGTPPANAGQLADVEAQASEGEHESNAVADHDRQLTTTPLAEWLASLNPATMQLAPAAGESTQGDSLAATAGEETPAVAGTPQRNANGLRRSGAHAAGTGAEGEAAGRLAAPNERVEWPAQTQQAAPETQAATSTAGTPGAGPAAAKTNADALAAAVTSLTDPTASASPAAEAPAATAVDVPTPATDADFPDVLATQVSVLVKDGVQRAELHLNPAEMGPISVQIAVDGSQAQVDFAAAAGATRELIENSLPLLAAALHEAGLTLAGGGVFEHGRHAGGAGHDGSPSSQRGNGSGRDTGTLEGAAASQQPAARRVAHRGMLDLYA